jgi:hypothetical protein
MGLFLYVLTVGGSIMGSGSSQAIEAVSSSGDSTKCSLIGSGELGDSRGNSPSRPGETGSLPLAVRDPGLRALATRPVAVSSSPVLAK